MHALLCQYLIHQAQAVAPGQLLLSVIPQAQVQIVVVVAVQVPPPAGAFAHLAETKLAYPAHLVQQMGGLPTPGVEHGELAAGDEFLALGQALHLGWRRTSVGPGPGGA